MLNPIQIDRIIEMAWEDRTPFEAIEYQFSLTEKKVIVLMRTELKRSSFKLWRARVNSGVSQKHLQKRTVFDAADKEQFLIIKSVKDKWRKSTNISLLRSLLY